MASAGMPPSPDTPVRAELVHESGRTRITRLFLATGTVIRKEMLGPDAERRLRHEAALLDRLRGVAGVGQLAQAPRFPRSARPASVTVSRTARPAISAPAFPAALIPGNRAGPHAASYAAVRWPELVGHSRSSLADALASITSALTAGHPQTA
jgi:hypothetical protein